MQRVKNVSYDEDDLYSDDDEYAGEQDEFTAEDKENFATLAPVVRAELEEADITVTTKQIEDALWHYYWDVGKSVAYLKNLGTPQQPKQQEGKKDKPKTKFDEANAANAVNADPKPPPPISAAAWFIGIPWTNVPAENIGLLVSAHPPRPEPRLLGGSSKLAKLAEERRRKAAAAAAQQPVCTTVAGPISALDRLSRPKEAKENDRPVAKEEAKKYPVRRKRSPTPPPRQPSPPPQQPKEEVPDLRSSPTAFGHTLAKSNGETQTSKPLTLRDLFGSGYSLDPFAAPSPDDTRTEAMKLDAAPKAKSKGLDVPKLWAEEQARRRSAAFVVIGHVDHGKSTLMGRLLLDTGAVAQRDIDKFKKQATEMGKASFALAWVMDTGAEERTRGVTVDIAQHHFSTDATDFTILDAPGHRDFVPNMIGGASMADIGLLVVDANQLESGMKGQTREHILLARAVGLQEVVVAVNKLDSTAKAWDESTFKSVSLEIRKLLVETGFSKDDIAIVPCSGLSGENVVKAPEAESEASWVRDKHPTLLQQLERSVPSSVLSDTVSRQLRMQIANVFRGGIQNPLSISGRIRKGNVQAGESIAIQPSGETATVKGVEMVGAAKEWAVAGDIVTLHLADIEAQHLRSGDVACSAAKPISVVKNVIARVQAIGALLPQEVDVHVGRLHIPGKISQLFSVVNAKEEMVKKKPRIVKAGQRALVRIALNNGAPLEPGDRIVLRTEGSTIAAGIVENVGR
ncbi:hypothetical protein CERZMDRAFT_112581 [Cercospora zeae-maydis SCOH1-5]|uniref:Tr-type G domain-containing protein n=1 Tax=Cercospora zeae-maydis SCOH1-5 TaxID=717836 RepID=A0A6A6FDN2_9PEZI|nr:hypothetical protein CERZMDRAFT_112581 [Cercospora zeae-maydis SCOH1-5]